MSFVCVKKSLSLRPAIDEVYIMVLISGRTVCRVEILLDAFINDLHLFLYLLSLQELTLLLLFKLHMLFPDELDGISSCPRIC